MLKQVLSLLLAGLLANAAGAFPTYANGKEDKEARFAEEVRGGISRLGTGEAARVEIKLRDKTRLKGYTREARAEGFVLVDAKTGAATMILYPQVKQVKGHNLSTGQKVALGVGITLGALLLLWLIVASSD
jgi:hypothetical protein